MIMNETVSRKRFLFFGLLQSCPLKMNDDPSCPLFEMRHDLSLEEKLSLSESIDVDELDRLLAEHEACFSRICSGLA